MQAKGIELLYLTGSGRQDEKTKLDLLQDLQPMTIAGKIRVQFVLPRRSVTPETYAAKDELR